MNRLLIGSLALAASLLASGPALASWTHGNVTLVSRTYGTSGTGSSTTGESASSTCPIDGTAYTNSSICGGYPSGAGGTESDTYAVTYTGTPACGANKISIKGTGCVSVCSHYIGGAKAKICRHLCSCTSYTNASCPAVTCYCVHTPGYPPCLSTCPYCAMKCGYYDYQVIQGTRSCFPTGCIVWDASLAVSPATITWTTSAQTCAATGYAGWAKAHADSIVTFGTIF